MNGERRVDKLIQWWRSTDTTYWAENDRMAVEELMGALVVQHETIKAAASAGCTLVYGFHDGPCAACIAAKALAL